MMQALGFTFCAGAYFSCDGSACTIGERANQGYRRQILKSLPARPKARRLDSKCIEKSTTSFTETDSVLRPSGTVLADMECIGFPLWTSCRF